MGNTNKDCYCSWCNAHLNIQHGFEGNNGSWICKKCGYVNPLPEIYTRLAKIRTEQGKIDEAVALYFAAKDFLAQRIKYNKKADIDGTPITALNRELYMFEMVRQETGV